jgi:hypothetical protein
MLSICAGAAALSMVVAACQPKNQDPGMTPNGMPPTGYPAYPPGQAPPAGYPPAGYPPGQTAQPGYPGAGAPTAAPPGATPMPAGSGQMAVPGPLALQCKDDVPCLTHRCNVQYGKCAMPCQSAVDCISPNTCMAGLCLPPMPAAH